MSATVYSRKAVLAAAYKLSDRCPVLVDTDDGDRWILHLVGTTPEDVPPLLERLTGELVDQALRCELEAEFGSLRTLIVAQAFSEGNLLDEQDETDARRSEEA